MTWTSRLSLNNNYWITCNNIDVYFLLSFRKASSHCLIRSRLSRPMTSELLYSASTVTAICTFTFRSFAVPTCASIDRSLKRRQTVSRSLCQWRCVFCVCFISSFLDMLSFNIDFIPHNSRQERVWDDVAVSTSFCKADQSWARPFTVADQPSLF